MCHDSGIAFLKQRPQMPHSHLIRHCPQCIDRFKPEAPGVCGHHLRDGDDSTRIADRAEGLDRQGLHRGAFLWVGGDFDQSLDGPGIAPEAQRLHCRCPQPELR